MIWLALFACLLVSFTFAGIEAGVLSVNRVRLRHFALRGEEAALQLDGLLRRIERLMATVVLITNLANVTALTILYFEFRRQFEVASAAALTLLVALPLFVIGLEFLPKAIFRRFPYRTLVVFARILGGADLILSPLLRVGVWLSQRIFNRGREFTSGRIVSAEELRRAIAQGVTAGERSVAEQRLVDRALEFRALKADDLMTPLNEVPRLTPDTEVSEVLRRAAQGDRDRYLVVEADGAVSGLVNAMDLLFDGVTAGRVQSYMRRVVLVGRGEGALEALVKLRAARLPLAVVLDKKARPVGVLTRDQLVQRMLGGAKPAAG